MLRIFLLCPVIVAACARGATQSPIPRAQVDSAAYLVTLGVDTAYVQWHVLRGNDLRMDIVERIPRVRVLHVHALLNDDGTIRSLDRFAYLPMSTDTAAIEHSMLRTDSDSSIFETVTQTTRSRYALPGRVHLVIGLYNQQALPVLAHYAPTGIGDSVVSPHFGGVFGVRPLVIKRVARDTFTVSGQFVKVVPVHVARDGTSNGFNATASVFNTVARRVSWLPMDSVIRAFVATERARGAAGIASPRDTTRASLNGAMLLVDYGRPSKRGRKIFGGIVPWNAIWRVGANEATHFTTDKTLVVGPNELPPGRYTLWILPAPSGWQLIVNNEINVWGTDYNPAFDRFRVPLTLETLTNPLEKFTIAIDSTASGGALRFKWDTVAASIPFSVKR